MQRQPTVRPATKADFPEILRLTHAMWGEVGLDTSEGDWETAAAAFYSEQLGAGNLRAFVADHPDGSALVACGVGVIHHQMPTYWITNGKMGYLQWFSTEPAWRRLGLATEILSRLLDWLDGGDVTRIQLHAGSPDAAGLYQRAGFVPSVYPNLWRRR